MDCDFIIKTTIIILTTLKEQKRGERFWTNHWLTRHLHAMSHLQYPCIFQWILWARLTHWTCEDMEVHHLISKLPQPGYEFYSIARRKSEQLITKVQTKSWTIHPNPKSIQELTIKIINYYYYCHCLAGHSPSLWSENISLSIFVSIMTKVQGIDFTHFFS